jgi:anthranilate synthase
MRNIIESQEFVSESGIEISCTKTACDAEVLEVILKDMDYQKGMVLSSGIEYPGRYNRWEVGFVNPPLEIIATKGKVTFTALNSKGVIILSMLKPIILGNSAIALIAETDKKLDVSIIYSDEVFSEEQRSKQPSVMAPLRAIIDDFKAMEENMLGFFGALGYELIFEFESCDLKHVRTDKDKLYHLYFVDELYATDKQRDQSYKLEMMLSKNDMTTRGVDVTPFVSLDKNYTSSEFKATTKIQAHQDDTEFSQMVDDAREQMRLGNVFEVVYSRKLSAQVEGKPSALYKSMRELNPSPYEFICQFGEEQLVGTSPEMFVRIEGKRIESCPISGTIRRGENALEDEKRIRELLNSYKDEVELTMCTDVDRNDKSRLCEAGSVNLLARRTIERYVGLFHTVDHVEGQLRPEFNGLDGFLSHMWAVTLTGAPKKKAVQLIENAEAGTRGWYGGSVGCLAFNGDVNSTITIRTLHLKDNKATYQVGATLVWDSEGQAESDETMTKATAFYKVLGQFKPKETQNAAVQMDMNIGKGLKAIMIDHEDSFVHTLASYFRAFGMEVETYRCGMTADEISAKNPDLVIYSPGPGTPTDFGLPGLIQEVSKQKVPQFGVCLGLQGIVEAFGGKLTLLNEPKHGKIWHLDHVENGLFEGVKNHCEVAAYHSIIADSKFLPDVLKVTARNEQKDVMAIQHEQLPIMAVQFHPESILTMKNDAGMKMVHNVIKGLCK